MTVAVPQQTRGKSKEKENKTPPLETKSDDKTENAAPKTIPKSDNIATNNEKNSDQETNAAIPSIDGLPSL